MNDLKNHPEKVKPYIAHQFQTLLTAYGQEVSQETYEKMLRVIEKELLRYNKMDQRMLDKAYTEVMRNFTTYRKVCPSSYLTAFAKMNHK